MLLRTLVQSHKPLVALTIRDASAAQMACLVPLRHGARSKGSSSQKIRHGWRASGASEPVTTSPSRGLGTAALVGTGRPNASTQVLARCKWEGHRLSYQLAGETCFTGSSQLMSLATPYFTAGSCPPPTQRQFHMCSPSRGCWINCQPFLSSQQR